MKSKIISFGLVIVIIILVIVGVSKKSINGLIKVGVIAPLSGQYGVIGESMKNAMILALGDKKNIELVFEDSKFDAKLGLSAFQKLTSIDKVDMLVNMDSPTLEVITPIVRNTNIPVIQMFEATSHEKDSIFQLMPFSYALFSDLGKLAEKNYKKIALVYGGVSDVLSIDAEYFKKGIKSQDIIVDEVRLSSNSDFRSEITKMLSKNPDSFTLILAMNDGVKFLKEINVLKGNKKISLICDANTEFIVNDYIKAVGTSTFEGCLSTNLPNTTSDQFKIDYKNKYGSDPMIAADWGYDAITIIKKLESISKDKWIIEIQKMSFDGVSGKVAFDETGTRFTVSENRIFKDGKFIKLE